MLLVKIEAAYKNFKIIKIVISFSQDDVIDLDAFNADALQRRASGAFVSYSPL